MIDSERNKKMPDTINTIHEWRPRWYYVIHNKTSNKYYFGQTLRTDITKYLGSGIYWKPHCRKNGGYNHNNIEFIHKWWIEDRELAELLIHQFESKWPNYWLKSNKKWANLIPENTEDAPNFTDLSDESRKKAIDNRLITLMKTDDNGISGFKKIGKKISKSKHKIENNGLTVGQNGANKSAETKLNTIDSNGLNIHQQTGKKSKLTKDIIDENGLTTHQRVGRELAKKKYELIGHDGLNAHQRSGQATRETKTSEEWKSTKGIEASKKLKSSLGKIENNGKTVAQNRSESGGQTQKSEEWKIKNYKRCPHCGILCSPGNYKRWHNNNCRHK